MGPLGYQEMVVIVILALVIFGPRKLPELGKTVGKAMTEFRRASNELKATFNREMSAIEREGESLKQVTREVSNDISSTYNSSSYDEYDYDEEYGYEGSSSNDSQASGTDSTDSTAEDSSTVSASATQGAESTAADSAADAAPEGAAPAGDSEPATDAPETAGSKPPPESEAVTT